MNQLKLFSVTACCLIMLACLTVALTSCSGHYNDTVGPDDVAKAAQLCANQGGFIGVGASHIDGDTNIHAQCRSGAYVHQWYSKP